MKTLELWSASADAGVRYFSGTATYTCTLQAPPQWFSRRASFWLDLGEVANLATVTVNGQEVETLWHKPFRANVTSTLRPGENRIVLRVTNMCINRLVGDRQPDTRTRYTFTTWPAYGKETPLPPSGLLGPVVIVRQD